MSLTHGRKAAQGPFTGDASAERDSVRTEAVTRLTTLWAQAVRKETEKPEMLRDTNPDALSTQLSAAGARRLESIGT